MRFTYGIKQLRKYFPEEFGEWDDLGFIPLFYVIWKKFRKIYRNRTAILYRFPPNPLEPALYAHGTFDGKHIKFSAIHMAIGESRDSFCPYVEMIGNVSFSGEAAQEIYNRLERLVKEQDPMKLVEIARKELEYRSYLAGITFYDAIIKEYL